MIFQWPGILKFSHCNTNWALFSVLLPTAIHNPLQSDSFSKTKILIEFIGCRRIQMPLGQFFSIFGFFSVISL